MALYAEVKTLPLMKESLLLQTGKSLYNIDPTRDVLRAREALPAVGEPYVLIELGSISEKGDKFGEEFYELATIPVTYQVDTVKYYSRVVTITASSNEPEDFLSEFVERLQDNDWYDLYFNEEGLSIVSVGVVKPDDIPVDGGDYEIRSVVDLTITYFAKRSRISANIEKISYQTTTKADKGAELIGTDSTPDLP